MPATIEVDLTRTVDAADLVDALAARGLLGELVARDDRITVRISYSQNGKRLDVAHELEMCVSERGMPLIPTPVGERAYVLRPPAG